METIVIIASIGVPIFVVIIVGIGVWKIHTHWKEEKFKRDRQSQIMKRVIDKKNEIIFRMSELLDD